MLALVIKLNKIGYKFFALVCKPSHKNIRKINFAITYKCNSRCITCNIWKKDKNLIEKEIGFEEIKNVFVNSVYLKKLDSITLTGGEPFLRPDIIDLYGFFITTYPHISVTIPTNSLNPSLIIDRLKSIHELYNTQNLFISISLDGIGVAHDDIRGVKGSYTKAIKLIEYIKYEFPTVKLGLSFTINPMNNLYLSDVYKLSESYGLNLGIQFAQHSSNFYGNDDKKFYLDDIALLDIKKDIDKIIRDKYKNMKLLHKIIGSELYYLAHMVDFQQTHSRFSPCYSGSNSFFMDPFGDVYPCIMLNEKMGNIDDFDNMWISTKADEIRQGISDAKCACWTPCETLPSLDHNMKIIGWNINNILRGRLK